MRAMTLGSPKGFSTIAPFPRSLSAILLSVGGLALFLIFASSVLISHPLGSTVQGYFLGVDHLRKPELAFININQTSKLHQQQNTLKNRHQDASSKKISPGSLEADGLAWVPTSSSDTIGEADPASQLVSLNASEPVKIDQPSLDFSNDSRNVHSESHDDKKAPSNSKITNIVLSTSNSSRKVDPWSCDLYHGKWFYDPSGPLYTNNTCPIITQMQNCQGNGRPDKDYENWRWKPTQCDLPRFDAKKFLELMKGKTLAFIGDSVARNQMESMLCILWQVETPKNRGNRKMQRWYFRSTSVMIVRIWSSWLVHTTSEPFEFAPEGVVKLHLDAPDEGFMNFIPTFDVVVLSSGHWFAKQSVYILNNEIVGGQLWWPNKNRKKKIDNIEAFRISTETILTAMVTHPNYTGLTIVRSFSPDHYEGGAWNTGGSCTGKVRPVLENELVANGFTDVMHEKQVTGFKKAIRKVANKPKLRLMDITDVFGYRPDGHPGPYRSPDPNKVTKRGPHGEPPPQDCLHWCMPGPVDTWNELVLEIIRREYEDA